MVGSIGLADDPVKLVLINKPDPPKLPKILRQNPAKGIVLMKVLLSDKGRVEQVELIRSSTIDALDSFLTAWINEWEYLVDFQGKSTRSVYTVVTIRYDLAEQQFDTPMTATSAMILPQSMSNSPETDAANAPSASIRLKSDPELRMTSIPPAIQNLNAKGLNVFILQILPDGTVETVNPETPVDHREIHDWITAYLKGTIWTFDQEAPRKILVKVPVEYDTGMCKCSFGRVSELR